MNAHSHCIITINTDNDDCQNDHDIARILHKLADRIERDGLERVTKVMDGNGNSIGTVQ